MAQGTRELFETFTRSVGPMIEGFRRRGMELTIARKADRTLVTEADLQVQTVLVDLIRAADPEARIVAEETQSLTAVGPSTRTWVIDPIDGTAAFVDPAAVEFCSVVAVVEYGVPVACWVLAPELGPGRTAVEIMLTGPRSRPLVNGRPTAVLGTRPWASVSATRSVGTDPLLFEASLAARSVAVKTRTTSQTLDQVRVACDLTGSGVEQRFDWFLRRRQSLWDGAAGIALALSQGLAVVDLAGQPLTPFSEALLAAPVPRHDAVLMAQPADVATILDLLAGEERRA
jgi:3'(2'), 5'-bisphosphate nucleotidase